MKQSTLMLIVMTVSVFLAVPVIADHHAVKVVKQETLGKYLTDAEGMTLYWFTKDQPGLSACSGGCLEKWPVFYRKMIVPPEGVAKSDFQTIKRADGVPQTTFRGYPLYYFFKDEMAGHAKGQGLKEVWYVIDPASFPNR